MNDYELIACFNVLIYPCKNKKLDKRSFGEAHLKYDYIAIYSNVQWDEIQAR